MSTSKRFGPRERMWAVIAAWMGGHLSEGQATKLLNISAVDLRECGNEYKQVADEMWARFRETGETIDDDIKTMVAFQQFSNTPHHGD